MGAKASPLPSDVTLGGSLMHNREPDFSGYVTRAGVKCSDGRTIMPDAFKHQDKTQVPLVWQHNHDEPGNVLGHTVLENREDGVYGYSYLNETENATNARILVKHDDIKFMSIYANRLTEKAANVIHGFIREVSLVMAGANPGAFIDNISVQHAEGGPVVTLDDEAIIYNDSELTHENVASPSSEKPPVPPVKHEEGDDDKTIQDVYEAMSDEQKAVVHYLVGAAAEGSGEDLEQSALTHTDQEGTVRMSRNVFEQQKKGGEKPAPVLSHDDIKGIFADAEKTGSLKDSLAGHALKHGIENIEVLFPDARTLDATPQFDQRRVEWVSGVINGTRHSPFSRIKTVVADITQDEARAKGYIKGNMKKEEWFGVSKRTTGPSTVYKKQKLDRDDIIDIVDFDVVIWMKGEMRVMLDEELARAVLIGDGREVDDEDKIKDPMGAAEGTGIRSIANEHELFAATIFVNVDDADSKATEVVDAIIGGMALYKGSGSPTFYTTLPFLTWCLTSRDQFDHRLWKTAAELAAEMGVANIVTVEVMEGEDDLCGIIVNLKDYTIGADKGGDVAFFDDFDIDFNQYKYLLETRVSGALTRIRSAVIVRKTEAADVLVAPTPPAFDKDTGVITVPAQTGVIYRRMDDGSEVPAGALAALDPGESLKIEASPDDGYYFANNVKDNWTYKRPAA